MKFDQGIFELYSQLYENRREVELSLEEYLRKCSDDPSYYAGAAERMLRAIGEPVMVDTSQDPRLGRIFMNRIDDPSLTRETVDLIKRVESLEKLILAEATADKKSKCQLVPYQLTLGTSRAADTNQYRRHLSRSSSSTVSGNRRKMAQRLRNKYPHGRF